MDVLPIGTSFKMDKFFRDLVQLADDEATEVFNPVEYLEDLNKVSLKKCFIKTPFLFNIFLFLFSLYFQVVRKRIHKKRSNGKISFDLGNGVKISVASYNLVQKAYKPSKVS